MIKALVVEDDVHKRDQIINFIRLRFPGLIVQSANSLMSGVKALREFGPDIVFLDMTLPNYDALGEDFAGGMQAFGGEEFLRQARRFRIRVDVIVVTQFETFGDEAGAKDRAELALELAQEFPESFRGMIYYHASLSGWSEELALAVQRTMRRRAETL